MPPSHHSSSHHSSSSRSSSSSHHSSSHRSSGRSHSSHSSSHHSYSTSSGSRALSSYRRSSRSGYSAPVIRTRINQPVGWTDSKKSIRHYRLKNHDYDYYPLSWNTPDGKHYEEGYYDENGQYYRNLFVPGSNMMLVCAYCGNHMMYTCKDGELPECPGCGAQFIMDATDNIQDVENDRGRNYTQRRIFKWIAVIIIFLFARRILGSVAQQIVDSRLAGRGYQLYETDQKAVSAIKDSVYVEEIGRTCYLDDGDWYDSTTQCWFWFNTDTPPYQWQYWYEGISSDYGDYGWMEFDMDSQQWYIEVDDGDWELLPDTYDRSYLWHFTDEYMNPFN